MLWIRQKEYSIEEKESKSTLVLHYLLLLVNRLWVIINKYQLIFVIKNFTVYHIFGCSALVDIPNKTQQIAQFKYQV